MDFESVYKCDRCLRTFDNIKIIHGTYGTRHCNKCIIQLRKHELQIRISTWRPQLQN